jgi:hypothetical protein
MQVAVFGGHGFVERHVVGPLKESGRELFNCLYPQHVDGDYYRWQFFSTLFSTRGVQRKLHRNRAEALPLL